ncbi:PEP-CTERM sorting domain-containing protein [Persicirhabdus sediminis]|uniref:PEP-CTERM sorting domain-containing protein n=1 Tax=Persicirhabdus sediminis TaxID=454144 RepID=A0A8J7SK08_9BACT|nr:PEP-CTERM sorting domain-containing protein [Persicirhabdus sediminis]MBK1792525.1 PEP-CTERM sorting domain-containing protein [Persicirhabdus sediminis]
MTIAICILQSSTSHAASVVTYSVDSATELTGSFEFDYVIDSGIGGGTTIANFPHFHISLLPPESYVPGSSYVLIEIGASNTIDIGGVDINFPTLRTASRQYDTSGGVLASYPDFNGSFLSPFDGTTTINYSYTNVGESSLGVFSGDFSYTVVPEPSIAVLLGAAAGAFAFNRRRN